MAWCRATVTWQLCLVAMAALVVLPSAARQVSSYTDGSNTLLDVDPEEVTPKEDPTELIGGWELEEGQVGLAIYQ